MSHDALAELVTILAATAMGVIGLLYRQFRIEIRSQHEVDIQRLDILERNQKVVILTIYHLATGQPLPEHVKEEIERRILNGKLK